MSSYVRLIVCSCSFCVFSFSFFFFNDTATTEIYTLSLHDALPISWRAKAFIPRRPGFPSRQVGTWREGDRKSTRLNSSHRTISYAVFCLKKKKIEENSKKRQQEKKSGSTRVHDTRKPRLSRCSTNS